ncbi:PDD2L-like protein [Mya arenaria]|uniref:PDD2L-like protein n=1 Tax=Mya arenaria TaxID=6604 RepID=A0ABY7DFZ6_MYAAR|nr:programmed cell death protein 2-like [Mya arenaria]WAQ95843.1 PDD2L-like protein [Mya arenaria]
MSCLLGLVDADITAKTITSWTVSKVGGKPDWFTTTSPKVPPCEVCRGRTVLVVQLYCPLEGSLYHRTLYIFACPRQPCWNKTQGWIVYRCQQLVQDSDKPEQSTDSTTSANKLKPQSHGDDWGCVADDWGEADDWGGADENVGGGDSWGTDGEDRVAKGREGDGMDDLVADIRRGASHASHVGHEEIKHDDWGNGDMGWGDEGGDGNNTEKPNESNGISKLQLQQLCIDDIVENEDEQENKQTASHVIAEDNSLAISDDYKIEALKSLQQQSEDMASAENSVTLRSYYIDVFDEPEQTETHNKHVAKLLKEYQKREGCTVSDILENSSNAGGGGREKYEKSSISRGDPVFHAFMKRVTICPEQTIRYQWSGEPLYISTPVTAPPSQCSHCQGPVVFELQLMPALVNKLHFPGHFGCALEFGTVLVYTCRATCWGNEDMFRVEPVIVQADPDESLFHHS